MDQLDTLSHSELERLLAPCCGSTRWLCEVVSRAPFADLEAIERVSASAFDRLREPDWLESFAAHPRIGDLDALRERFGATSQESREQATTGSAPDSILRSLAENNMRYERRFGFRFLVFATGKTAEEMLGILRARLGNQVEEEMKIASSEQRKITALRIGRLFEG